MREIFRLLARRIWPNKDQLGQERRGVSLRVITPTETTFVGSAPAPKVMRQFMADIHSNWRGAVTIPLDPLNPNNREWRMTMRA